MAVDSSPRCRYSCWRWHRVSTACVDTFKYSVYSVVVGSREPCLLYESSTITAHPRYAFHNPLWAGTATKGEALKKERFSILKKRNIRGWKAAAVYIGCGLVITVVGIVGALLAYAMWAMDTFW